MSSLPISMPQPVKYPERDGKPMGETDVHRREIAQVIEMLELFFQDVADVYVTGNLLLYYEEGNPAVFTVPDVFVVKGVPKGLRRTYKLWEEGQTPVTIFEMTSRSTRLEDKGTKRALFAMLGVHEYFMFDPLDEYLKPSLQGFTLEGDEYIPMQPDADGALVSQELGLSILRDGTYLRLVDLATGHPLLRAAELDEARRAEREARRAAEQRLIETERELERLRAEIKRLRRGEN